MAALSAAANRKSRNRQAVKYATYTVATGATVYNGSLCAIVKTTGRVTPASAATNRRIVGIAMETKTAGNPVRIEWSAEWAFNPDTTLTKGYTGCNVAASTDNDVITMSGAGTAAVRVRVGEMIQWVSTSEAWIAIRNFCVNDV